MTNEKWILANKLHKIVKDKCKNVPPDIGLELAQCVEECIGQIEPPVKPTCETVKMVDEMLREADILKEHKNYVYNLDNAERLRGYKLALLRLKEKIMSKSL